MRPERAQEALRTFSAENDIGISIPGVLPRADFLRAVGAAARPIFQRKKLPRGGFWGALQG